MPLLEWRRPSDIAGLIPPVIVDSVERHSFRAISDLFHDLFSKEGVVITPAVEHSNAATAVMLKTVVFGIVAPLFDGFPSAIKRRAWPSGRAAMLQRAGIAELGARSATGGVAASEPSDAHSALNAAFASAKPVRAASLHVREADCGEFAKNLAGDVELTHKPTLAQSTKDARGTSRETGAPSCG